MRTLLTAALLAALTLPGCGKKEEPPPPPPFAPLELAVGENKEGYITLETTGEVVLKLEGSATGAQWGKKGAEAIGIRITMNGRLTRELFWVTGETAFSTGVAFGKMNAGQHTLKVEVVQSLTRSETTAGLKITAASLVAHTDQALARYAPVLLGKAESNYNDLPVLLAGTKTATGFRYTVVYTHQDGAPGLDPRQVMAQNARLTGIETAYEVDVDGSGNVTAARFKKNADGPLATFAGAKEGDHALLRIDGPNSLFADDASGAYTFAPEVIAFDDAAQPLERVLDANPWVYALTDGELLREGRVDATCANLAKAWPSDCYLYVEGEVTSMNNLGGRRVYGIELQPMGGNVIQSELDLGAAGRGGKLGHTRIAVPLKKEQGVTAVRFYAAAQGDDFLVFLRSPRAMRLVAGAPTEVFLKSGISVKAGPNLPPTTFYP